MAFNQRLIVVQTPINAREKRKRKKRSFAHFVFNFCSFRFCDYIIPSIIVLCSHSMLTKLRTDTAHHLVCSLYTFPKQLHVSWKTHQAFIAAGICIDVSSNFASADFRKIKTYNFWKSESYRFQKLRNLQISEIKSRQVVL